MVVSAGQFLADHVVGVVLVEWLMSTVLMRVISAIVGDADVARLDDASVVVAPVRQDGVMRG